MCVGGRCCKWTAPNRPSPSALALHGPSPFQAVTVMGWTTWGHKAGREQRRLCWPPTRVGGGVGGPRPP